MSSIILPRIAITVGEPAGIGPDIVLQLATKALPAHIVAIADTDLLQRRADLLGIPVTISPLHEPLGSEPHTAGRLDVIHVPLQAPSIAGQLSPANAQYVLNTLRIAGEGCINRHFDAVVTAPVHKGVINDAGIAFSGHTEFFADMTNTPEVVMMLTTSGLSVALVTTHIPLSKVSTSITRERLRTVISILHHDLQTKFGLEHPRILVCGLNPHAGEGGHLGYEEIEVIMPVLEEFRREQVTLIGPVAADTAFTPSSLENIDVVLAMYHDQGLAPLKQRGFGEAVNITLGLPIIRTSVDHGTALQLAATGRASSDSLHAAVQAALEIVARRRAY